MSYTSRRQLEMASKIASLRSHKPEDFSKRTLIPDSRIAIFSDVHIPYHDEHLLAEAFERAQRERVQAIVWLGDLLDIPTYSSWGRTDYKTSLINELQQVRGIIEMAAEMFPVQYWSMGNHEMRWMRKLDHQVYLEQLARMAGLTDLIEDGKLILSDNPTLDADEGRWMLTHPGQYGSSPLVIPAKLAVRYQQNVMSAHAHHWGMTTDETNNFIAVETGGLFQPDYHQYIQHNVTTHREWVQGYWLLIDGTPMGYMGRKKNVRRSA